VWKTAAATGHRSSNDEGLFRAIAQARVGRKGDLEEWFRNFLNANERNRQSSRSETQSGAYYLAGIYAAFRGEPEKAEESFRRSLEIDRSDFWAQQASAWRAAGLLQRLAP
jgi:hypothetical protein